LVERVENTLDVFGEGKTFHIFSLYQRVKWSLLNVLMS